MATEVWRWQGGTDQYDKAGGVSVGPNGSCTLAGWTYGDWGANHTGAADYAAVNVDATGALQWTWQGGTERYEYFHAAATGQDGSIVMVGHRMDENVAARLAAVKLDADGGLLWEWEEESRARAQAFAVATTEDGGAIWAGSTFGVWGEKSYGGYDFTVSKMDADGTIVWSWQNGTAEKDELNAVVVGDDGTVVLAGYTYGNWTSPHGGDNDTDFAAVKLDAEGTELWRWQNGTTGDDTLHGAASGHDGSTVLAGVTEGSWKGAHAGGKDFCAVKLDADGGEVWRWQGGTNKDDFIMGVASGNDGSAILAGYTKGAWSGSSDGSYDLAAVKLDADGTVVWRWQAGATLSAADKGVGVAAGPDGSVVLAGYTEGSWGVRDNNEELYDFVVVMLDTDDATATPSPATGILPVADALSSTPTPTGIRASSTLTPELPPPATAIPLTPSLAPLAAMRTSTPGPSSYIPFVGVSTSPTSAFRAPVSRAPASAAPATYASVEATSTAATSFSPVGIGIVAVVATVALIVAGVCLRMRLQAKQNSGDKDDKDVPVLTAEQGGATTTNNIVTSAGDPCAPSGTRDVVQAVLEAANDLALNSQFPGVSEAATLVLTLVNLISNDRGRMAESEARLKRCRLLVTMLQQAATVLGKIDNVEDTDSSKEMKLMLIENVQDAIGDMVGLIKTYNSKKRITQVVVSTLFKRRMEETEAVINQTFSDLMRWLHIDTALNQKEDRRNLANHRGQATRIRRRLTKQHAMVGPYFRRATAEVQAESIVADRRLRRLRNLNQIEIPEDHVVISEDVLGKGGFGTVYIADYNGRNAAAKVIRIDHDNEKSNGSGDEDARSEFDRGKTGAKRQRASLLLELQAMIRLRSPHTVNVYGAITSRKDKLILVMELLTGGDLCTFLKHSTKKIPEPQARTIIQDVCAGMAFLHSKSAVHGDLKSANVLLDGEGRAKIGDFGTSRWAQHSNSTGLATYNRTHGNVSNTMSFAWAAPEVLSARGISSASDVYSFGIVAWEVLSMEVPWADEALPFDIYTRVVFKGDRPEIPGDAPVDIAGVLRACWAALPEARPASADVMEILKAHVLNP